LPPAAPEHSRTLAAAHRTVGEPGATLLIAEGRGMQLDEATALARTSLATVSEANAVGPPLTAREREVAVLLARGYSNREVAEALVVGKRTAEMHVTNLLNKLGLSSRSQVAVWAVQNGLLTETP
jgi:DNA-binding NarL/FixJ family response regulator